MKKNSKLIPLIVSAIGVVYGDIGTSPLYALASCFSISKISVSPENVMGIISLICWSLFLIVSIKYVKLVLRVDKDGEGGVLVLSGVCAIINLKKYQFIPLYCGIFGTALFFGDGVITPAISVLSALEGLSLISHAFEPYIIWIAVIVLLILFLIQKSGSSIIGSYFGPIMILWFLTIGVMGFYNIYQFPVILKSLSPYYALSFFYNHGLVSLVLMGGIVLVITGAEALYADISHFGKFPISVSWNYFIFPSLLLNYFGQGALLLKLPSAIENPFYLMASPQLLYPLIILSTMATIIASQSMISGVFSLSWQAIMLNFLPKMKVMHTSVNQRGQVYVPAINFILCICTITAVLFFKHSSSLVVAYGFNASGVMFLTTLMLMIVSHYKWKWSYLKIIILLLPLLLIDAIFVLTNSFKLLEGSWFTMAISVIVSFSIITWIKGNQKKQKIKNRKLVTFIRNHHSKWKQKIPGTAIYICSSVNDIPDALAIQLQHNKYLHEKMFFISMVTDSRPITNPHTKYTVTKINDFSTHMKIKFGFKEKPDMEKIINFARSKHLVEKDLSFFCSKSIPISTKKYGLQYLSERFYIFLEKNSLADYDFYDVPEDKVIELMHKYKL